MNRRKLREFFDSSVSRNQPMALATVYSTSGSTYSKTGARMLIDANGVFRGMLSGGCLEGDLAIRAQQAIESGLPQLVNYDLSDGDDELWGLGVGCDGVMRIFIQALDAAAGYEPYRTIANLELGRERARAITVVESTSSAAPAGATLILAGADASNFGFAAAASEMILDSLRTLAEEVDGLHELGVGQALLKVLVTEIEPIPRLLVLGAGLDAEPLVRMAAEAGWYSAVVDHRPAYITNNDFATAEKCMCIAAKDLSKRIDLGNFDLAIVMSHHLATDQTYLAQLAQSDISYIGLLGPPGRRDRLLTKLGSAAQSLQGRLRGPAGIDLGGRGPAAIALSIVAEMQQYLAHR
jgi:xanthine/CO dehydrogenase XdhC/CoxF family maturation factor